MRLLTVKEAARMLSISEKTLYQWNWLKKNLPFIRVGGALRIREEDLFLFIQKNKQPVND